MDDDHPCAIDDGPTGRAFVQWQEWRRRRTSCTGIVPRSTVLAGPRAAAPVVVDGCAYGLTAALLDLVAGQLRLGERIVATP
jgi:hypothetical protein